MWLSSIQSIPEFLSVYEFGILTISLLFLFRYFQHIGVILFMTLAVVIGNIQILTEAHFSYITLPLGTIAFSMTFLATNLLNAHYGRNIATKAVLLTFCSQMFFGGMMFITSWYQPVEASQIYHQSMVTLFSPSFRFFSASMFSYLASQMLDIYLFDRLRKRSLIMRFNISVWVSGLLDNTIFSFLAFYIFPTDSISLHTLIFQYILGTYWIRVMIGCVETPIIYLSYFIKTKSNQI